jgi:hypothetical protein
MKREEIKVNRMVIDKWWREWGWGRIIDVKKNVFTVNFGNNNIKYDCAHAQFLEPAE